jgi:hypothetical protein
MQRDNAMNVEAQRSELKPGSKLLRPLPPQPVWKITLATTGVMLSVLALARLVGGVPKPLLLVIGISFVAWAAIYGYQNRTEIRPVLWSFLPLLLPWLIVGATLLGTLYFADRGGWLWFLVTGYDVTPVDNLTAQIERTPAEFVRQYPAFVLDPQDDTRLLLPRGQYNFSHTVVVPRDTVLTIAPGADLRFGGGRSLISYSPILAQGRADAPIRFGAQHKWLKWGVVGITDTAKSVFTHVHIEDSRQARVNDIEFVAGLSVFDADVEITHSKFVHAFGKDAVNVRRGHVLIQNNLFQDAHKDGLDLDGGAGEVSYNQFVDCADEGIDLSENEEIRVVHNIVLDQRGGRISADQGLDEIRAANTQGYSNQ